MFEKFYYAYKAEWRKASKNIKNDENSTGRLWEKAIYLFNRVKAAKKASKHPVLFVITLILYFITGALSLVWTLSGVLRFVLGMDFTYNYFMVIVSNYIVVGFLLKMMPSSIEITLNDEMLQSSQTVLMDQRKSFENRIVDPLNKAIALFDLDPMYSIQWALEEWDKLYIKIENKFSLRRWIIKFSGSITISIVAFFAGRICDKVFSDANLTAILLAFTGVLLSGLAISLGTNIIKEFLENSDENIQCMEDMRQALIYCKHFGYPRTQVD